MNNTNIWIHRTTKENANNIISEGFKLPSDAPDEVGRFGRGIYFMDSLNFGWAGDATITVNVNCPIISLTHSEICDIYKHLNLQPEEEGVIELKEYVENKGYSAVEVSYADGTSELVVYDIAVIENIRLDRYRLLFEDKCMNKSFLWSIESRDVTSDLLELLESQQIQMDYPIYRGTMYNKRDIVTGHVYEHCVDITSWSKSKEYAKNFLNGNEYIPEGILEDYAEEIGAEDDWDSILSDFAMILIKLKNPVGVDIHQMLIDMDEERFVEEEEVQLINCKLIFTSVKKVNHNSIKSDYYEIEAEYVK